MTTAREAGPPSANLLIVRCIRLFGRPSLLAPRRGVASPACAIGGFRTGEPLPSLHAIRTHERRGRVPLQPRSLLGRVHARRSLGVHHQRSSPRCSSNGIAVVPVVQQHEIRRKALLSEELVEAKYVNWVLVVFSDAREPSAIGRHLRREVHEKRRHLYAQLVRYPLQAGGRWWR